LFLSALLGCSNKSPPTPTGGSSAPPFAKSTVGEHSDKQDPCSLLDPKEVEAVLGAPLAVPPFRSFEGALDPLPTGKDCVYETDQFRHISLHVEFSGGVQTWSMSLGTVKGLMKGGAGNAEIANTVKKTFKVDEGTEMSGEWDEASLMPLTCCTFATLRGDQFISIDFTASRTTLRQAAGLADAAYKRIDHPLNIDGASAVAAAKGLDKTRPQPVDACSILNRTEVEAIVGPLTAAPRATSKTECAYMLQPEFDTPVEADLQISWRGGYSTLRSDRYVAGIGGSAVNPIASGTSAAPPAGQEMKAQVPDPDETVGPAGMGVAAVKRDVLVKIAGSMSNSPEDKAKQKALIEAVMQKI